MPTPEIRPLAGRTLFITGASRGIGKAIALRAARDGANIAIVAKTTKPHPTLPGTIFSAAEDIEAAGGLALPLAADIREEHQLLQAVAATVERFGGLDILVNNASAISLTNTLNTPMRRFDLMMDVNTRGTFAASQACLPHLLKAANPHILTLAPPPTLDPKWYKDHVAYTIAKMGMSLVTLGLAEEYRGRVGVNALWPRTLIATAALAMIPGVDATSGRIPEIVADAAHAILSRDAHTTTGRFFIDEEALAEAGITDLGPYAVTPGADLLPDIFL